MPGLGGEPHMGQHMEMFRQVMAGGMGPGVIGDRVMGMGMPMMMGGDPTSGLRRWRCPVR